MKNTQYNNKYYLSLSIFLYPTLSFFFFSSFLSTLPYSPSLTLLLYSTHLSFLNPLFKHILYFSHSKPHLYSLPFYTPFLLLILLYFILIHKLCFFILLSTVLQINYFRFIFLYVIFFF